MIPAFAGLIFCQWCGELLSRAFALPLPGPVLGMLLLLIFLMLRGAASGRKGDSARAVPAALASVADGLLGHLSILFVPAAVGVMSYFDLLSVHALPAVGALVLSTVLAMAVTGLVFRLLAPEGNKP